MNSVNLTGRLTRNPELRSIPSGAKVVNFSIAVPRNYISDGQPDADFINIVAWNKSAEFVNNYFVKGMKIEVVGRIQTRTWEDEEGNRRYATEVVSDWLSFGESKSKNDEYKSKAGKTGDVETADDSFEINDDDLPF